MKLICIENITSEQLRDVLPPKNYFWTELWGDSIKDMFMFALTDDDSDTIGIAVFQTYKGEKTSVCCVYVMTVEKYRRQGYATKLLLGAMEDLKARGYTHILAVSEENSDLAVSGLIKKCGMTPYDKDINFGYFIGKLKETGIASKFEQAGAFKNVKKMDELSDFSLRKFEKKELVRGYKLDFRSFNPKYCRFFVIGDEIQGVLLADTKENEYFYTLDVWIEPSEKTGMAFPLMMFSLVNGVVEEAGEESGLILSFREQKQAEAMKKYFGEPEESLELSYLQYK